jgi:hypothetical protein
MHRDNAINERIEARLDDTGIAIKRRRRLHQYRFDFRFGARRLDNARCRLGRINRHAYSFVGSSFPVFKPTH